MALIALKGIEKSVELICIIFVSYWLLAITCQYVCFTVAKGSKKQLFRVTDWLSSFEFPYQCILLFIPTQFETFFGVNIKAVFSKKLVKPYVGVGEISICGTPSFAPKRYVIKVSLVARFYTIKQDARRFCF